MDFMPHCALLRRFALRQQTCIIVYLRTAFADICQNILSMSKPGFFFGRFKKTELPKKLSVKKTEAFLPKKLRVPEGT